MGTADATGGARKGRHEMPRESYYTARHEAREARRRKDRAVDAMTLIAGAVLIILVWVLR